MNAVIDIGSNTVRLLVGEVKLDAQTNRPWVKVHLQKLATTRLGNTKTGTHLDPLGVEKTLAALGQFQKIMTELGVEAKPLVAATSAVREASDQEGFAEKIKAKFGWDLQILSGEQEGRMAYLGASGVVAKRSVIIDVGGGSTEIIFAKGNELVSKSVKVGAVRLFNQELCSADLPALLAPLVQALPGSDQDLGLIGVGGTVTTVGALKGGVTQYSREAVTGVTLDLGDIEGLFKELKPLTPAQRLERYPLLKNRADIIVAGLEIYCVFMKLTGFRQLVVSDGGILDGLLLAADKASAHPAGF